MRDAQHAVSVVMGAVRVMGEDRLGDVRERYQEENVLLRGCIGRLRRHIRQAVELCPAPDIDAELRQALALEIPGPRRRM